jgi:hypothetical protein
VCASPSDGRGAPGDVTTHGSRDGIVSAAQCTGEVAGAWMGQNQTSRIDERVDGVKGVVGSLAGAGGVGLQSRRSFISGCSWECVASRVAYSVLLQTLLREGAVNEALLLPPMLAITGCTEAEPVYSRTSLVQTGPGSFHFHNSTINKTSLSIPPSD